MLLSIQEKQTFFGRLSQVRKIDPDLVIPKTNRHAHDLSEVGVDGVFRFDGKTYVVQARSVYRQADDAWQAKTANQKVVTELILFGLEDGSRRFAEWTRDDDLEICWSEHKLKQQALRGRLFYDNGDAVSLQEVDAICENEWILLLDGNPYHYDDDFNMLFQASDGRTGYVGLAEFNQPDTKNWLTIESWTSNPADEAAWEYEMWLSQVVQPRQFEIFSLGQKGG